MSRAFRRVWYAYTRMLDEAGAKFDSLMLSTWLAAATGHWPRRIRADGLPRIRLHPSSQLEIGDEVRLISRSGLNAVGGTERVIIWVGPTGHVSIGDRSGLSHATIVCLKRIEIGRGVLIGGGARVFDSDFHALPSPAARSAASPVALPV